MACIFISVLGQYRSTGVSDTAFDMCIYFSDSYQWYMTYVTMHNVRIVETSNTRPRCRGAAM